MSKTAPTSKPAHVQAADKHNETDKAFLERNHVKSILNNLLETLNRHQPDDPLNFIYTYFQSLQNQEDAVKIAYDRLKSITFHSDAFDDCLLEIYNMFLKATVAEINHLNNMSMISKFKKSIPKAQFGDLFNKLIDLLLSDLSPNTQKSMFEKLKRRENDAYSFTYFKSAIRCIFLLKEFLGEAGALYADMERYSGQGKVNKTSCVCLIEKLESSLKILTESKSIKPSNQKVIETIYELSPTGLTSFLSENNIRMAQSKETASLEEFQEMASVCFIKSILL